jgi:hypothetical protein
MNKLNQFLTNTLLHTYLIVFYFILKGIIELKLTVNEWLEPFYILIGLLLMVFLAIGLSYLMTKNTIKNGIVISAFLFAFLFALPIFKTLNYWLPSLIDRVRYSFFICLALCFTITFIVITSKKTFKSVNYYLNVLFLLFSLLDITIYLKNKMTFNELDTDYLLTQQNNKNKDNYNVYLFVPDGYSSNKALKKYWQYDNTAFTNYLKDKGFFIANNSKSNYHLSVQSISAALNLGYLLPEMSEYYLSNSIEDNKIVKTLHQLGYDCFAYEFTGRYYEYDPLKNRLNIQGYYTGQTIMPFLLTIMRSRHAVIDLPIGFYDANAFQKSDTILSHKSTKKQFMYAHSMLTHPPFSGQLDTFDAHSKALTGHIMTQIGVEGWLSVPNKPRYFGQEEIDFVRKKYGETITATNVLLKENLDKHWAKIADNSIIIIMGDHGSRLISGTPEAATDDMYSNFCAIYFPDRDYSALNDTITPINVMRSVMNKAIGTHLPYLPDKSEMFGLYH